MTVSCVHFAGVKDGHTDSTQHELCRCEIEIVLADDRRAADERKRRFRDITVFWAAHGQATACLYLVNGVSDAKRHRGREISVRTWAEGWRCQRFGRAEASRMWERSREAAGGGSVVHVSFGRRSDDF